jgi:pyrimidine deaminase RibD-like protein
MMLPSEKIELAIYKAVDKGRGPVTFITTMPLLARLTGEDDHPSIADRLKALEADNRLKLSKWQGNRMWPRGDSPDHFFFYTGEFGIEIIPQGRRYFEQLEQRAASEQQTPAEQSQDRKFARLAIDEARRSVPEDDGRPHPRVGAVVVKDGQVVATAHRGEVEGNHAEYLALEKKLADAVVAGATVYTTLEPCTTRNHPKIPCAERLIERKVGRVVIGMLDPDSRITGRGQRKLRSANIITEFFPHDLMSEVEELNREFTRNIEAASNVALPPRLSATSPSPEANLVLCQIGFLHLYRTGDEFRVAHVSEGSEGPFPRFHGIVAEIMNASKPGSSVGPAKNIKAELATQLASREELLGPLTWIDTTCNTISIEMGNPALILLAVAKKAEPGEWKVPINRRPRADVLPGANKIELRRLEKRDEVNVQLRILHPDSGRTLKTFEGAYRWGENAKDPEFRFGPGVAVTPALELSQHDPHVYLEVTDTHRAGIRVTPFILKNLGDTAARRIHIPEIAGARFEEVDLIAARQTCEVLPITNGTQIFGVNNIFPAIESLWEDDDKQEEFETGMVVPFTISYQDVVGRKFEVDVELTYLSLLDKIKQSSIQRRGSSHIDKRIVKTRHIAHRRLS